MRSLTKILTVSLVLTCSVQLAVAAGEKPKAGPSAKPRIGTRMLNGAKKVGRGIMTLPFWMQYAMPSTQLNIAAGKAAQRGGRSGRFLSKTLRVAGAGSLVAERLALISLVSGGPSEVAQLFTDPMANDAVQQFTHPLASPFNAIIVGANLATIPLTRRAFRRAFNEGQLRELAKEFGTTKQDINITSEYFRAIVGEDHRHTEARQFFRELQTERERTGAKTLAELAMKRFEEKFGSVATLEKRQQAAEEAE